jgi:3-deoxy-D-manno-octulosonate 8-phosphate phosphatase (KDO 8-P phosphatase)
MEFPFFERLAGIRGFVFSFEGVFTNNKLLALNNGELIREVNQLDGRALAITVHNRYRIAILTEEDSKGVTNWLSYKGVRDIFGQNELKQAAYETFAIENGLDLKETVFMGSDVLDHAAMLLAGISACPADAAPEIKAVANYVCEAKGGEGCVKEILRLVMKAQKRWPW